MRELRVLSFFVVLGFLCSCADTETSEQTAADISQSVDTYVEPPDETAPAWGDDAELKFLNVRQDSLVLVWPEASDEKGVISYHVFKNDESMAVLDSEALSLQVHQLDSNTEYTFRIEAKDAAGNLSNDGPKGTIKTGDETAPTFNENAELTATDVTASSATLTWEAATDNVAVGKYRLYQNNVELVALESDATTHKVDQLKPWQSYTFRLEAEDNAGNKTTNGPSVTIKTADDQAPVWPEEASMATSMLTTQSVSLGWDSATDDVAVTHYQVLMDGKEIALLDADTTWYKVLGLTPGVTYKFEVFARDEAGNATKKSLTATVLTLDDESPTWPNDSTLLASSPSDSGVTLTWSKANDNVAVTGYRLYQDNVEISTHKADETSTEVTNLKSNASYVFRVEAEDAAKNLSFGGPTLSLDLSDKTAPAWPQDAKCNASQLTPTSVLLDWSKATDNVAVSAYNILSDNKVIKSVPAEQLGALIEDLTPVTEYTLTVQAVDAVGNATTDGPSVTVTTTDYPEPAFPDDAALTAKAPTATSVTLSWSKANADPPIKSYEVFQDDQSIQTVEAKNTSLLVSGLKPLTTYAFRVEALGTTGKTSTNGPTLSVTTPDYGAPTWPQDAQLTVSNLTETALTLSWSLALDEPPTAKYEVHQDGQLLGTVDAPKATYDVSGLSAGTTYQFKVEAVGTTGQVSKDGPGATATTPDKQAPTWPQDAALVATKVGPDSIDLSWTAANDNVAVTDYHVMKDGSEAAKTNGNTTVASISGLSKSTEYTFTVMAKDGAGNETANALTLKISTLSGQAVPTNKEVFDGISAQCVNCHEKFSPPAFMASLDAFNTDIVQNPKYVVPGKPDESLLIKLMEGNGTGNFKQMPTFGDSFKVLSDKGQTQMTIEQVRYWIEAMSPTQ